MQSRLKNSQPDVCVVAWEVTDRCNYQCWYCPEHLHAGRTKWPDSEVALRYFKFLKEQNPGGVYIDMLGGEPTLWPDLADFVEGLPEGIDCEVSTNGSRTMRWWERVGPRLKRVTISHHFASANDDHILELAGFLKPIVETNVLLLLDPLYKDRIKAMQIALVNLGITYETKPIFPAFNRKMLEYDDECREILLSHYRSTKQYPPNCKPKDIWLNDEKMRPRDLIISGQNNFEGWFCLAGSKKIHVDFYGDVWAGSCKIQKLGNMADLPLFNDPVICNKKLCTCVDDVRVEKWTNEETLD